jgi:ADP-ribose pyrophosphatase YjhB (NUDIX family)
LKYCSDCGAHVTHKIPEADDRLRFVCDHCNTIHYQNPKIVVGALAVWEGKILLCKRAIEPQYGLWTLPAGFMENGESTLAGAERETFEEAGAKFQDAEIYRLFDIPYINQVYIFYRATLVAPEYSSGIESLETVLFAEQDIPWDDLAFPVIHDVLEEYFADIKKGRFIVRSGLPDYRAKA